MYDLNLCVQKKIIYIAKGNSSELHVYSKIWLFLFLFTDFLFSTAHKAKGLEFSTVKVTDDYGVNPILQMLFRHVPEIAQAMPPNASMY